MNYTKIMLLNVSALTISELPIEQILQIGVLSLSAIISLLEAIKKLRNNNKNEF